MIELKNCQQWEMKGKLQFHSSLMFMAQEMVREFSLFEEALLIFEARDPHVELYTKFAAAVQNAI